jgi:hypothetical protein
VERRAHRPAARGHVAVVATAATARPARSLSPAPSRVGSDPVAGRLEQARTAPRRLARARATGRTSTTTTAATSRTRLSTASLVAREPNTHRRTGEASGRPTIWADRVLRTLRLGPTRIDHLFLLVDEPS